MSEDARRPRPAGRAEDRPTVAMPTPAEGSAPAEEALPPSRRTPPPRPADDTSSSEAEPGRRSSLTAPGSVGESAHEPPPASATPAPTGWPPSFDLRAWNAEAFALGGDAGPLAPGQLLAGRFRLHRFLAHGGMGEVWEAVDQELAGERLAIKTIRPGIAADDWAMTSFRREIQLAKRVSHPNVCRVHDLFVHQPENHAGGPAGRVVFLSMELLGGETLASRLARGGPLPPAAALAVLRDVAGGLAAAHQRGVVHGDLKTANVMLVDRGEGHVQAVITDFGLARPHGGAPGDVTARVAPGNVLGTPAYMAPEQVRGERPTPAADIYALGLVLCEILTGRLPFEAETPLGVAVKRLTDPPTRPTQLRAELPLSWERTILACLERDPAARPPSPLAVVRLAEGEDAAAPTTLAPTPAPAATARGLGRRRLLGWGAALLAALAVGVLVHSTLDRDGAQEEEATAAAGVARRPALAVLPFRPQRPDPASAWIATAIAEALTSELGRDSERLRVIPSEDVSLARAGLPAGEVLASTAIAALQVRLGSDLLVSGTYTAYAGGLRIDARLHDLASADGVASFDAEGSAEQPFAVVSALAAAMRRHLGLPAAPDLAAAGFPRGESGGRAYAEGIERLRAFDAAAALPWLERAIAEDEAAPLPRIALAEALLALGYEARAGEAVAAARVRAAGLGRGQQLALDAFSAELAADWPTAIEARRSAYRLLADELDPGLKLIATLTEAGRPEEAQRVVDELRERHADDRARPRIDLAEGEVARARADFERLRELTQAATAAREPPPSQLLVARAHLLRAAAERQLGRGEEALAAAERARALYAAAGDRGGAARAEVELALAALRRGDHDRAEQILLAAGGSFNTLGDRRGVELIETDLGLVAWARGDLAGAHRRFVTAVEIARELGSPKRLAGALSNLGMAARAEGGLDEAVAVHEEALALRRRIGDRQGEAISLNNLARTREDLGDLAGAAGRYAEALVLFEAVGDRRSSADALLNLAVLERYRGAIVDSRAHLERALALKREVGDRAGEAAVLASLATTELVAGRLEVAELRFGEALAAEEALGRAAPAARARLGLLEVALERGEAARVLAELDRLPRAAGSTLAVRIALVESAAARAAGLAERARAAAERAIAEAGEEPHWVLAPELLAARARTTPGDASRELLAEASRLEGSGRELQALELRLAAAEELATHDPTAARALAREVQAAAARIGAGRLADAAGSRLAEGS